MRPAGVFVDTGAWVALRYKRDGRHTRARSLLRKLRKEHLRLVTSEWILAESVTLLKARGATEHAIALGDALQSGQICVLVEATAERRRRSWDLFCRYRQLDAGYVDCTSFAVMEELGLRCYFGFDDDFVAAGFEPYR